MRHLNRKDTEGTLSSDELRLKKRTISSLWKFCWKKSVWYIFKLVERDRWYLRKRWNVDSSYLHTRREILKEPVDCEMRPGSLGSIAL